MSSGGTVSEEEFQALHQQLMDLKMKHYESLDKEKKLTNEINLEKKKLKALEESLEHEAIENKKLLDNVKKLNGQLNTVKDRQKVTEILEENSALKRRLEMVEGDYKEQMSALRKNIEHMFQENQTLKDENRNLKATIPSPSPSPSGEEKAPTLTLPTEETSSEISQRNAGDRRFTSQEREELQTKLLLLRSETEELRSANEELETSIKNFSVQKAQLEGDNQRVLAKLSQLQLELTTMLDKLNEKTKECSELTQKMKTQESQLQVARSIYDIKEKLEKEIYELKTQNVALNQECDSYRSASSKNFADLFTMKEQFQDQSSYVKKLEDEVKTIPELQQRLTMLSVQHNDMHKLVVRVQEEATMHKRAMDDAILEKLQAQAEYREARLESEKVAKELRTQIEQLTLQVNNADEEKTKALDALNNRFCEERATLEHDIRSLQAQIETLTNEQNRLSQVELSSLRDLDSAKHLLSEYSFEIQTLKNIVKELKESIEDKEEESFILEKKRNNLVKELKIQLKTEALRVKDLDAALKAARDELKQPRHRGSIQRAMLVGPSPQPSTSMSITTRRSSNPLVPGKTGVSPLPSRTISLSPEQRSGSDSMDSLSPAHELEQMMTSSAPPAISLANQEGDETAVMTDSFSGLITEKFTRLQKQNFVLQEKIQYLEESVQKLTAELEKKKAIINNLLKRIEVGALPSINATTQKTNITNQALKEELFKKMEVILHETTLENANLREGLDKLGMAFKSLHKENLKLKGEYDEMHDSKDSTPTYAGQRINHDDIPDFEDNSHLSQSQSVIDLP